MNLTEKKVIVTGGLKGIGRVLVDKLIDEGAKIGVFDIDAEGLKDLKSYHENIFGFECDVSKFKQVSITVDKFYEEFKQIDALVNNAGILYSAPLVSLTPDGITGHSVDMWQKVISTDLSSVFYMTVNVVEKMIQKRTKGVIVNISSVSAAGNAGQTAYSAAKAGVNALTATWAKELGVFGIRVVAVAPGYSDTESTHVAVNENVLKDILKKVPLRRLGKAEEIANGIICAIKNDFFNGKILEVDGGLVI
jgi:3-oxoacyl-[acyl-carrier protein] reductase